MTHEEFETLLEEAASYLECPPAHNSAEAAGFAALLRKIERYQPELETKGPDDPLARRFGELEQELTRFREKYLEHEPPAFAPNFGLGQDLRG